MPSHRASAPPPLSTYSTGESSDRSSDLGSEPSDKGKSKYRSFSNGWFDHKKPGGGRSSHNRTTSESSAMGNKSSSKPPSSPTKNVYTHCGRHTDQYLLGGRSMTDLLRNVFAKKE